MDGNEFCLPGPPLHRDPYGTQNSEDDVIDSDMEFIEWYLYNELEIPELAGRS